MSHNPTSGGSGDRGHLPPWLRDVPLPAPPSSRSGPGSVAAAGGGFAAEPEIPDFLSDMPGEAAADQSGEALPDWLSSSEGESSTSEEPLPPRAPGDDTASRLPPLRGATDWLRSMGIEDDTPKQEPSGKSSTEPSAEEPPAVQPALDDIQGLDWLRDVSQDELAADLDAAGFAQPQQPEQSAFNPDSFGGPVDDQTMPSGALPNWLSEETSTPSDADEFEPDWMKDESFESPPPPQAPPPESGGDIPDWLLGGETEQPSAGQTAPTEPSGEYQSDVPDWLQGEEVGSAPAEPPAAPAAETGSGDESIPDWLQGEMGGAPAEPPPEPPAAPAAETGSGDESIPDWLQGEMGGAPAEPPAAPAAETGSGDESIPDWLQGEMGGAPEAPPAGPARGGTGMFGDESIPSWLQEAPADEAASPAAPAEPPAVTGSGDESIPDWLQGEMGGAPEEPPAGSARGGTGMFGDESIPSWLQEAPADEAASPAMPAEPAAATGSGDESIPSWLQEAPADEAASLAMPAEPPAQGAEDIPDWLREEPGPVEPAAEPGEDVPPWLQQEAESAPTAAAGDVNIPDWLLPEESSPAPAEPAPAEAAPPPSQADDVPPWLIDEEPASPAASPPRDARAADDMPPWLQEDSGDAGPSMPPPDAGLPAWLQGAELDEEAPQQPDDREPQARRTEGMPEEAPGETPPDRQYAQALPVVGDAGPVEESSGIIGGADLPSWLRPAEQKQPVDTGDSQAVNWLANLGIPDEESDVAVASAAPEELLPRPAYTRSAAQLESIRLLQKLVEQPVPEAAPVPEVQRLSVWQRIGVDRALYIVLALALFAGAFFAGILNEAGLESLAPNTGNVSAVVAAVEELESGADAGNTVLLAYEWDAQRISEMRPLEEAITSHIIEQGAYIITVSTDFQGTILSFDLRDRMQAAGYQERGVDYILLGYKPGGEIALRNMVQDFNETLSSDFVGQDQNIANVGSQIDQLDELAMIVLMADQPQDVQRWMEQVYREVPEVPLVVLVPAEVAPVVAPYLVQENVLHLAGKRDALTYTEVRGAASTDAELVEAAQLNTQLLFAVLVFVLLLVVGALIKVLQQRADEQ